MTHARGTRRHQLRSLPHPAHADDAGRAAPYTAHLSRLSLFRTKRMFKSRLFPGILRLMSLAILAPGLFWLLAGPADPVGNVAHVAMWLVWWPLFIMQFLLLGRFWCAACPFGAIGDALRRFCGLDLPVPPLLKRFGPLVIGVLLLVIVWAEEALNIKNDPRATAALLLSVITAVVLVSLVFERRAWCRFMCPLGGMGVAYARIGMLQIRGNPDKCRTCNSALCFHGTEDVEGCPMHEFPRIKDSNAYCIFCGNCVKTCPRDSAKVEMRLPSDELWLLRKPGLGEALLCALLFGVVSLALFQNGLPHVFEHLAGALGWGGGPAGYSLVFSAWQAAILLLLGAAGLASTLCNRVSVKMNATVFAHALIPLTLGAHLALGLRQLVQGWGALHPLLAWLPGAPALDAPGLVASQAVLILAGFGLSLLAARAAGRTFFSEQGKALVSLAPFAALYAAFAGLLLWFALAAPAMPGIPPAAGPGISGIRVALGFGLALAFMAAAAWLARTLLHPAERMIRRLHRFPVRAELSVRNEASEIVTAQRALARLAETVGVGAKPVFDACLALEELMTDALLRLPEKGGAAEEEPAADARPAGGGPWRLAAGRRPVLRLRFTVRQDGIEITMASPRPPHNPLELLRMAPEEGMIRDSRANRQLYRLKRYMSDLGYERRDGCNVLTVFCGFEPRQQKGVTGPAGSRPSA